VEIEQLFDAAQPRPDIAEPRRDAVHLLEEFVREDVAVDVDDRFAGHGWRPVSASSSRHARVSAVGWVERSETQHNAASRMLGLAQSARPNLRTARAMTTESHTLKTSRGRRP